MNGVEMSLRKLGKLLSVRVVGRAGLMSVALVLLCATAAPAYLYWADTSGFSIGRSALDGSHPRRGFLSLMATDGVPCGVAVSGQYLYWADEEKGSIGRALLDGRGKPDPAFITGASLPCGVAVYRDHLYWANKMLAGSIGRANLTGPRDVHENFVPNEQVSDGHDLAQPCGVAAGPTGIYWSDAIGGSIGHANLNGSAEHTLITGGIQACGVALSPRYVYWTDQANGTIGRALLDGADADSQYITGLNGPCGAAVTSDYLYFADRTTIDRTDLSSPSPTAATEQIVAGLRDACGVATR
jgi:virginiamycin B lyase